MSPEMAVFHAIRRCWTSAVIVILLGAVAIAGDRAIFAVLRGEPDESTAPLGYYEGLLHTKGEAATEIGPPPGWIAFGAEEAGIVDEVSSYLRWRIRPNLDKNWNGSVFRTNSLGSRSREVSVQKPPGTYRILFFGSSNTMGYGVGNDEIYTLLLERWLNERSRPDASVEVVNFAVSGDSPSRRLYRIPLRRGGLGPDWILCDVSLFDPWLEDRQHPARHRVRSAADPTSRPSSRRSGGAACGVGSRSRSLPRGFVTVRAARSTPSTTGWAAGMSRRIGFPS